MSIQSFLLLVVSILAYVGGQLLLKRALGVTGQPAMPRSRSVALFSMAIGFLSLDFFLWLELLRRFDLSYIFPCQALTIVVMCIGARIFLRERISPRMIVSIVFIVAGISLVATT